MRRIEKRIIQLALLIIFVSGHALAKDPGIDAFYKGDYKKAGDYYDARLKKDKENEKIMFNSGTSALAQQEYEKANSLLMQSLATEDESQLAKAHYNLGQLALQQQKTDEALAHFIKSMIYDPDDPNAKIMYEYIRQQQQQQEKDQESNSNNQDQENKNQDKDQDQKQQQEQQQQDQQKQDPRDDDTPPDQEKADQQQQKQQQQQDSQLSEEDLQAQDLTKEQAKNILNAMKEEEKESMKKLIMSQAKGKKIKRSKEW